MFSIELRKVEVIGRGIVVNEQGQVVLESTLFQREYLRRTFQNHWIVFRRFFRPTQYAYAVPLINYLDRNYFHWTMESIGRLVIVKDQLNEPALKILVDQDVPRFVQESISFFFNIPQERIVNDGHRRRKIDRCLLPSFPHTRNAGTGNANVYAPETIQWMNKTALEKVSPAKGAPVNFIISRRNTTQRALVGEERILTRFPKADFRIVELEAMTFREQVELFANAGTIIATHGAGLTNLVFARSPLVIEFFPEVREEKDSSYFFQITSTLGMRHYMLMYEPASIRQELIMNDHWLNELARIMNANGHITS
jgi:capsular polysaccharide biosynthesis protein